MIFAKKIMKLFVETLLEVIEEKYNFELKNPPEPDDPLLPKGGNPPEPDDPLHPMGNPPEPDDPLNEVK
jgi:hypothetical protein